MKNLFQDQRGMGVALIIILTAYIFIMGSAALALATSSRRNAGLEVCRQKAYYTAEAGVEQALSIIRFGRLDMSKLESGTLSLVPDYITREYADGQISYVNVSKTGGSEEQYNITLESLGVFQQAVCSLKVDAEVISAVEPPFLYTIKILSWKINE